MRRTAGINFMVKVIGIKSERAVVTVIPGRSPNKPPNTVPKRSIPMFKGSVITFIKAITASIRDFTSKRDVHISGISCFHGMNDVTLFSKAPNQIATGNKGKRLSS